MKSLVFFVLVFFTTLSFSQVTLTEMHTNLSCVGMSNGSFTVTASGGSAPYTYTLSSPVQVNGTGVFSGLPAGNYTVYAQDALANGSVIIINIMSPTPINVNMTHTNVSCFGGCNGAANATVFGGASPYTYLWTVTSSNLPSLTGLCAGQQTLVVTDANGCTATRTVSITEPTQLTSVTTVTNSNCGQANGAYCITPSGGTAPYTYVSNFGATPPCNNNVTAAAYGYTVTDSKGCMTYAMALVNDFAGVTVSVLSQTNVSCFGGNNGAATTTITGGVTPYSIVWSTSSATTSSVFNLAAGVHAITVTDAAGCVGIANFSIYQPSPLNVITSPMNASCGDCNGSIAAAAMGGSPAYTYVWFPSNTTTSFLQGICAGNYSLQVMDGQGCVSITTVNVGSTGTGSLSGITTSYTVINETCIGSGDGAIDLELGGSNPGPFTYEWNNGATIEDLNNIGSGTYQVTIFDAAMACMTNTVAVGVDGTNCGTISGNVFIDNNSDCIKNTGDLDLNNAMIIVNPGNRLGYTNANGDYMVNNLPYGAYTITATTNTITMASTCNLSLTTTVNSGAPISANNNFSKELIPVSQPDLYVSASNLGVVPGFACTMNYYLNNFNASSAAGIFKATLPSSFIPNIINAAPSTYTLSGDTIMWSFTNVTNSTSMYFYVTFTTPLSAPLGSAFTSCMYALPNATDLNYANNNFCYWRTVNGSFDPNDKSVSPVGVGANGDIPASQTDLTYLINFQNTGNGPAVNIVVKDTLSPNVDISTFEMLNASHNYNIDILPGNILRWKFNNIMLPDSNSNEPGSHGFIQYRIKRTSNNTPGTQIKNTAYIYFDFNEPVVTNTALNTIETITGIKSQLSSNDNWNMYPNPSNGTLYIVNSSSLKEQSSIEVVNSIGQTILQENINGNYKTLDLNRLNNGIYFVKITSDTKSTVKRIVLSK